MPTPFEIIAGGMEFAVEGEYHSVEHASHELYKIVPEVGPLSSHIPIP